MNFFHIIAAWWLVVASCAAGAITITEGPKIEVSGSKATLRWTTSSECGTRVRYGVSADKLDEKAGEGVGTEHTAVLENLGRGATYFYSIGTSRYELVKGSFTADGKASPIVSESKPAPAVTAKETPKAITKAPPTRQIWGHLASLPDHFARHGGDFKAASADDYARKAWEFLQRALNEGLPAKVDESDGTIRVWEPKTHTFAAFNRDFTAKTFFKPESAGYFERQPGKPIRLKRKE